MTGRHVDVLSEQPPEVALIGKPQRVCGRCGGRASDEEALHTLDPRVRLVAMGRDAKAGGKLPVEVTDA